MKVIPLPPYGDRRVTSVRLRLTVGRAVIWALLMFVAAPVFSVVNLVAASEITMASFSISVSSLMEAKSA